VVERMRKKRMIYDYVADGSAMQSKSKVQNEVEDGKVV